MWRPSINVKDHESSCANQEASLRHGLVRPIVVQNTRVHESAKLERQHFNLQSSLKNKRHIGSCGCGQVCRRCDFLWLNALASIFRAMRYYALESIFRLS